MNSRRRLASFVAFAVTVVVVLLTSTCARRSRYLERTVTIGDRTYRYRVWLPQHYTKLHHWPVVLFLHGSSERGDDNLRQVTTGLAPALERYGERYKCIAVFPQCAFSQEWYGEMETQALAALEQSIREFHGDRRRVYVTGVSMGGSGAWFMARHARRFAAIIPVAGEVVRKPDDPFPIDPPPDIARIVGSPNPYATLATAVGRTPVWMFHGSADDVISPNESRSMFAAIRTAGGRAQYTEYPGVGHACWDLAYADRNLVHWMLAQRLGR